MLSFKEDNSTAVFYGEAASRSVETISISSAPRDLNVANLGPLSVHISWSEPQEMAGDVQLIGYNVECKTGQICKHDTVSANQSIVIGLTGRSDGQQLLSCTSCPIKVCVYNNRPPLRPKLKRNLQGRGALKIR